MRQSIRRDWGDTRSRRGAREARGYDETDLPGIETDAREIETNSTPIIPVARARRKAEA